MDRGVRRARSQPYSRHGNDAAEEEEVLAALRAPRRCRHETNEQEWPMIGPIGCRHPPRGTPQLQIDWGPVGLAGETRTHEERYTFEPPGMLKSEDIDEYLTQRRVPAEDALAHNIVVALRETLAKRRRDENEFILFPVLPEEFSALFCDNAVTSAELLAGVRIKLDAESFSDKLEKATGINICKRVNNERGWYKEVCVVFDLVVVVTVVYVAVAVVFCNSSFQSKWLCCWVSHGC